MKQKRFLTARYGCLQGAYWMMFCASCAFAMELLRTKGVADAVTGVVLAVSSIITLFGQPVLAAAVERSNGRLKLRMLVVLASVIGMALALSLGFASGPAAAVIFCLLMVIVRGMWPFIDSIAFGYINRGYKLNFGLARSAGSVVYAVASTALGVFVAKLGGNALSFLSVALLGLVAATAWTMGEPAGKGHSEDAAAPTPLKEFIRRYPRFCLLLLAFTLLFFQHSVINTYLTQIMEAVGGDSVAKGVALAIAAAAEMIPMALFAILTKKFSIRKLLRFAVIFMAVKAVWFMVATSVFSLYLAHAMQIFGYGIYIPASVYYANRLMAERDRVKGVSLANLPMTLGSIIGTLLGSWLLSAGGLSTLMIVATISSAVGCVISFFALENV